MKSPAPKILVIDDDSRLRDLLVRYLTEQGFQVQALPDARDLDKKLQRDPPHLLVLDLLLPGEDGLAVCRRLRGAGEMVPVIMLTAKGEDVDRIVGLEMGADDYLPKPFNPRELVARIHAVLRRHTDHLAPGAPALEGKISFGPYHLDLTTRTLLRGDKVVPLTTGEFGLLKVLATHPRQPRTKTQLLARTRPTSSIARSTCGLAPAQADPSDAATRYPDRLGFRLRVRAGRVTKRVPVTATTAESEPGLTLAALAVRPARAAVAAGRHRQQRSRHLLFRQDRVALLERQFDDTRSCS
jgi:DNA-binding response OmpR family regulator